MSNDDKPQKVYGQYPASYDNRNTASPSEQLTKQGAQQDVPYISGAETPKKGVK